MTSPPDTQHRTLSDGMSEADRRRAESLPGIALLIALTAVAPLAVDMFLPSMPTMAEEFDVPSSTMQLAVTLFLLSFAASQLVYGSFSDRYGRRPVLMAGMLLFIAGGVIALLAPSAEVLILGRVVQGLGGGAGPAIGRAIVLDVFGRTRAARVMAYMTIATPLAPAIAPIVGGFLHDAFDWRAVFVTLIAIGVFLLVAYRMLIPESNLQPAPDALNARRLAANYATLFRSRPFVAYSLVMGLMFSGQLVFISGSSFVLIDELGVSPTLFGFSFAFVAVGIMSGAWISSRLVSRWLETRVVLLGATIAAGASLVMAALAWGDVASPWAVLLPMFATAGGLGISRPPAMAGALIPFPHMAGLASAVMGFTQMIFATLYNIGYSSFIEVDQVALASGVAFATTTALVIFLAFRPPAASELAASELAAR
ncbi:MAG: multidrug effflux MFS transporter [Chloroflexi bacterium]|nr:multidrug effflux MFS transporter [Chloroflexota bacterium]MDA1147066.1 multidrug effflux MFS transporter [Chloroflexota bacterium]